MFVGPMAGDVSGEDDGVAHAPVDPALGDALPAGGVAVPGVFVDVTG